MYLRGIVSDLDRDKGLLEIEGLRLVADSDRIVHVKKGDEVVVAFHLEWRRRKDDGGWFPLRKVDGVSPV